MLRRIEGISMPELKTFGRRAQAAATQPRPLDAEKLSPAAQAFIAQIPLTAESSADFGKWRRTRQSRLALAWLLRLALLAPGLLSLKFHASWQIAICLELAGLAAAWWLKRERRRHRAEIVAWSDEQAADRVTRGS